MLPGSGLGGTGEVKHAELAVHLGRLQLGLEPVQQLHHLRVQLKVREVVVHPQQEDPCHLVMWRRAGGTFIQKRLVKTIPKLIVIDMKIVCVLRLHI